MQTLEGTCCYINLLFNEFELGLGVLLREHRSFTGTNGIIKNDAIVPKKRTNNIERVLKNIGTNVKRTVIG